MKKPPPDGPGSGFKSAANCFILNTRGDSLITTARRGCRGIVNRGRINDRASVVGDTPRIHNTSGVHNRLWIVRGIYRTIRGVRRVVGIVAACFCPLWRGEHNGRSDHCDQQATSDYTIHRFPPICSDFLKGGLPPERDKKLIFSCHLGSTA